MGHLIQRQKDSSKETTNVFLVLIAPVWHTLSPIIPRLFSPMGFPPDENVVVVAIFSRDVVVGDHQERCFINVKTRLQTITVCKNTQLPFFTAIKPSDIMNLLNPPWENIYLWSFFLKKNKLNAVQFYIRLKKNICHFFR